MIFISLVLEGRRFWVLVIFLGVERLFLFLVRLRIGSWLFDRLFV